MECASWEGYFFPLLVSVREVRATVVWRRYKVGIFQAARKMGAEGECDQSDG